MDEIPEELIELEKLGPRLGRKAGRDEFDNAQLPWNQSQKQLGVSKFGMKSNSYASPTAGFGSGGFGSAGYGSAGYGAAGHGPSSNAFDKGKSGTGSTGHNPGFGKAFTVQKPSSLDYGVGDRVSHVKFGEGTVQSVKDGAKDFEVTVDFDRSGVKKMFASFAKLQKV